MPFITDPIVERQFSDVNESLTWMKEQEEGLCRLSVIGTLNSDARIADDQYLTDGDMLLRVNDNALGDICSFSGIRKEAIQRIQEPGLASRVLNDLIFHRSVLENLENQEWVLDQRTNTIIGMVSKSYRLLSNVELINQTVQFCTANKLDIQEVIWANTNLSVRTTSNIEHGIFKEGIKDTTFIGLEVGNSMVGKSSVSLAYFIRRLICTNGMTVPASVAVNRVIHSGRSIAFRERVQQLLQEGLRNLDGVKEQLTTLGSIPFIPERITEKSSIGRQFVEHSFEVIEGSRTELSRLDKNLPLRVDRNLSGDELTRAQRTLDARALSALVLAYSEPASRGIFTASRRDSATAWDFVNVFTEYAKKFADKPSVKLGIETRAGRLASFISANKTKL